jgi:hypothetical protein
MTKRDETREGVAEKKKKKKTISRKTPIDRRRGDENAKALGGAIRLGVGPNVSRASRAQDRGGDAPAAPLRRPCRRGTRPSCPCGPSPCGSGRGDEGGWVSAGRARFPRDDRVSVGTRTGPKKNCKDPTSAVAGDEAQSRDCRQASCLVTFAFTRGSHLQPPAVVVLLGLIKACLDLAGVRELIVGVVVRPKLIRSAFETAKRIFDKIWCRSTSFFIRGDAGAARGRCRPRWRRGVGHRSRRWHAWCTDTQSWCTSRRCSSRRSSRSALYVPRRFGNLSSCPPRPRTASPSLESASHRLTLFVFR